MMTPFLRLVLVGLGWLSGLAHGPQRARPRDDLVEHQVDLVLMAGVRREPGEFLEVGEERPHHLRTPRGDHAFGHHNAQVLDPARAAYHAVADQPRRLTVPFARKVLAPAGPRVESGKSWSVRVDLVWTLINRKK